MAKMRRKYIASLDRQLRALYVEGGFEVRKINALWAEIEKLEAEEARESSGRGN